MSNLSEEEKKAIEYLKARLYGNTGCKFIDVAQKDLRIFLYIVENQKKGLKQANTIIAEQDKEIIKKNNKICDLEFKIEKQQAELENKNKVINLMAKGILNIDKEIGQENNRENKIKQTSDDLTEETRYYTPEGEIYKTIIETYKCPKNYISKNKIRTLLHSYAIDDENLKKYLEEMLEEN